MPILPKPKQTVASPNFKTFISLQTGAGNWTLSTSPQIASFFKNQDLPV
jgi:hypothetical protein